MDSDIAEPERDSILNNCTSWVTSHSSNSDHLQNPHREARAESVSEPSPPVDYIRPNLDDKAVVELQDALTEELEPDESKQRPTYYDDDDDRLCERGEEDVYEDEDEFRKMCEEDVYDDEDELPEMGEEDVQDDEDELYERDKEDLYDLDPINWSTVYDSEEELDT